MNQIAQTIYEQIGGNKCMAMVGGHTLAYDTKAFMFRFKMCKQCNHCTITLNDKDLYDVKFIKIWGTKIKQYTNFADVYFDQLEDVFTQVTGLNTRLF